jgi:hypothetical protein
MNKHPSEKLLSLYVDGDLKSSQARKIESHLGGCVQCRKYVDEISSLKNLASNLEQVEVPPGMLAGIKERIAVQQPKPAFALWKGLVLGAALSAAAAFIVLMPHGDQPVPMVNQIDTLAPRLELNLASDPLGPPVGLASAKTVSTTVTPTKNDAELAYQTATAVQTVSRDSILDASGRGDRIFLVPLAVDSNSGYMVKENPDSNPSIDIVPLRKHPFAPQQKNDRVWCQPVSQTFVSPK